MKNLRLPESLRRHLPQIIKFCVSGGLGACIDLGTSSILHTQFGVAVPVAYICSTLLSVTFVFFVNKYITFRMGGHKMGNQLTKFAVVYAAAIILNFAISTGLYSMGVEFRIAKAIAIGIGAVINYVLSHSFVFKKSEREEIERIVV